MTVMTDSGDQQRARGGAERGRQADTPAQMPALGWKEIATRAYQQSGQDNIALVAAGVAFYAFLAIVPLMGATVLTYGFIASPETVLKNMQSLTAVAPPSIAETIGEMLLGVVESSGGKKGLGLIAALGIAIWGARNAAGSIMIALNIVYEEEEARGLIERTLLALAMTLGLVLLGLGAIVAMAMLHFLEQLWPGSSETAGLLGRILTYPLLGVGAAATAATIYRYGPSRDKAKWVWLTPGSIFAAIGWVVTTVGFGIYVTRFADYDKSYGSIGGIVALLTWLFVSAYVFLFGAELNSEVEHQTAKDTTAGAEKPLGKRGAWSADHVAGGADDEGEGMQSAHPQLLPQAGGELESAHPQPLPQASGGQGSTHPYLTSRVASRVGSMVGLRRLGIVSSILSTAGLSLLGTKGKARAGALLLGAAAGLALLRRKND